MPRALGKPLTPQPHPEPRYTSSGPHVSLSVAGISLSIGSGLKIQIPHCHHLFQASSVSSYKFSPQSKAHHFQEAPSRLLSALRLYKLFCQIKHLSALRTILWFRQSL